MMDLEDKLKQQMTAAIQSVSQATEQLRNNVKKIPNESSMLTTQAVNNVNDAEKQMTQAVDMLNKVFHDLEDVTMIPPIMQQYISTLRQNASKVSNMAKSLKERKNV